MAVDQPRPRTTADLAAPQAADTFAPVLDRLAMSALAAEQAQTRTVTLWSLSMISYIII
jgi:hypothetical protein